MKFNELLNKYLEDFACTSTELSKLTNISPSVISRYRSGQRTPSMESLQMKSLIKALAKISNENEEKIEKEFQKIFNKDSFDYETFSKNFNALINTLKINLKDMSKYTLCDSSNLSRIRYNKSKPSEPLDFSQKIANYIEAKYQAPEDIIKIEDLTEKTNESIYNKIFKYLTCSDKPQKDTIKNFLTNLDKFNLNDYIKAIKFDELKVPSIPFYHCKTKNYYGLEEMKKAEIEFLKGAVLNKNNKELFLCSNMPMEEMAKDLDFSKKWMFGIACSLKKGMHLNIIHNLDRPFNEMMLGLESWIPIYMTGGVTPYYFKKTDGNIYHNITYTTNNLALSGEAIAGFQNSGKYYLTNNKKEVEYYQTKAKNLLKKAYSLMDIYKEENQKNYNLFLNDLIKTKENTERILPNLPLFTISDSLLTEILKQNKINKQDIKKILEYKNKEYILYTNLLKTNKLIDNIYVPTKNEFNKPSITLSNIFYNKKITYSYENYQKHLKETFAFANNNKNYILNKTNFITFTNISINIIDKKIVIISKEENPTIHFVIRHPKLVNAISNFNPLIKE